MQVLMDYGDEVYLAIDKSEDPGFLERYFSKFKCVISDKRIVVILNDPKQIKQVFEFLEKCNGEFINAGGKLTEQYRKPEFVPHRRARTKQDDPKYWL